MILGIRVWFRNLIEWPGRRRFLAAKMRDLGLEPKFWQSNRARALTIMMLLTFPRDTSSASGLRRYVAWLLGVAPHRVSVSSDAPASILIRVPRRTRPDEMAKLALAIDREMPAEVVFRVECDGE